MVVVAAGVMGSSSSQNARFADDDEGTAGAAGSDECLGAGNSDKSKSVTTRSSKVDFQWKSSLFVD